MFAAVACAQRVVDVIYVGNEGPPARRRRRHGKRRHACAEVCGIVTTPQQQKHREAIDGLFAGRRPDRPLTICGDYSGYYGDGRPETWQAWLANDLPAMVERLRPLSEDARNFFPLLVEIVPYGTHYVDALFGARVYQTDQGFWSDNLPGSLRDLSPLDVGSLPLVKWTTETLHQALDIVPPEFVLTFPIFSSPLNIAINLFGEEGLMDLVAPDEGTLRGLAIIADLIAALHQRMRDEFPGGRVRFYCSTTRFAPDGVGHICGCSTQLVSGETYARHLAPLDARILSGYPGGGTIHLCGHHLQHLPAWRAMGQLRGVQVNDAASDDFAAYFSGLRDDQVIYVLPTPTMTVERILEISGGRRVILMTALPG